MRMTGIDFETTGLSPENDLITEVGLVVWDFKLESPVRVESCFLNWGIKTLDPVVTKLTGITMEMLEEFGQDPAGIYNDVNTIALETNSVAFVAHNGEVFDRPFYGHWGRRVGLEPLPLGWVDTQNDIPYDEGIKTRKLTHLAAEHGFLNPFAHRAVFDVLTMFKVLEQYDVEKVLALSKEPVVYLRADVSFQQKHLASARGYRWHPDLKVWWRSFKQSQVAQEKNECGFRTMEINKPPEEKR